MRKESAILLEWLEWDELRLKRVHVGLDRDRNVIDSAKVYSKSLGKSRISRAKSGLFLVREKAKIPGGW
jgi:hypothetical protein